MAANPVKPSPQHQWTHDEAREAALAFIDEHFGNKTHRRVQTRIPSQRDDTDVLLMTYISQQEIRQRGLLDALLRIARESADPVARADAHTAIVQATGATPEKARA